MLCAGCSREIAVGDRYIVDTSSGFTKTDANPVVDAIVASIFGGSDGLVWICEDCTEPGGDYLFATNYGDEEDAASFQDTSAP